MNTVSEVASTAHLSREQIGRIMARYRVTSGKG